MRNKSNIDHFFELVKQNPPLIEIDQVHQIITSPKAKARPKGKRNNLLKFTIMTTIFGLIISAVVFWPNVDNEVKKDNSEHQSNVQNFEITNTGSQAALALPSIDRAEIGMDSTDLNMKSLHSEVYIDPFFKEVLLTREQKDSVGTKVVTEKISQQSVDLFPQVICAVAYEAPSLSKFEIDIYGDIELKNVRNSKVAPPKDCLWLSVKSDSGSSLSSGEYTYTDNGFNFRQPFTFSGAMIHNNFEHKFKGGVLTIKRDSLRITISYDLILDNDFRLEGQYEGEYICTNDEQNTHKKSKVDIYGKPSQRVAQNHIAIKTYKPEPVQPIDGSRFILRLSDDELRKIGFEVNDTMFAYTQQVDTTVFRYTFIAHKRKPYSYENGKMIELEDQPLITVGNTEYGFHSYGVKGKLKNETYDFYPVFQSNLFYSEVVNNEKVQKEGFRLANDTLLPVVLPISELIPSVPDKFFWFTATEKFYASLSPKYKDVLEDFKKYKEAKKYYPNDDLIVYQAPKLFDESKIVVLSKEELIQLGFQLYTDTTIYAGCIDGLKIKFLKSKSSSIVVESSDSSIKKDRNLLAVMVTRTDGSPYRTFDKSSKLMDMTDREYGSQFPLLIPILLKSKESQFGEDVIYWFLPTYELFNTLPKGIGTELQKEYNYVVAEDKSQLEKPQCKYFDECKNTLKVTNFKVYPNPANNVATVSFTLPEAVNGRITLIDLTGRERQVLQSTANYAAGSHQFDVDLSTVASGIYLVALYADKGIQVQRLVVSR